MMAALQNVSLRVQMAVVLILHRSLNYNRSLKENSLSAAVRTSLMCTAIPTMQYPVKLRMKP